MEAAGTKPWELAKDKEHEGGTQLVRAGQAVITHAGEWVRYSTPEAGGAEYIAVCTPAFAMETVHRDG